MYIIKELFQPKQPLYPLQKLQEIIYSLFIYFFIGIVCVLIMKLTDLVLVKLIHHPSILKSHFDRKEYIKMLGLYKATILVTLIAPISEEISFRLLLRPTRFNVATSFSVLAFMLSGSVLFYIDFNFYLIRLLSCLLFFSIVYSLYRPIWILKLRVTQSKLLIFTSLCFGAIHVFNYSPIYQNILFLYPIYVLPQIILGFILGIIRIRNGFIWAVILHILVNGILTWPKLFI